MQNCFHFQEHTPLIVFGVAKIRRTKLMATLSGLKLEGEITGLQTSVQYKEKIRAPTKAVVEASVVGNMQETKVQSLPLSGFLSLLTRTPIYFEMELT